MSRNASATNCSKRLRVMRRCSSELHRPTGQCWTFSSVIGKSSTLAVASAASMPAAAAAIRQSAWCSVTPLRANARRQAPARMPSAAPRGARRRPLNNRRATASSPGCRPRQISSMEITQAHGCVPVLLREASRAAAALPRSASMSTVESSSSRATVSQSGAHPRDAVAAPTPRGLRPTRGRNPASCRAWLRYRPSDARFPNRAESARQSGRFSAAAPRAGRFPRRARRPTRCVNAWDLN